MNAFLQGNLQELCAYVYDPNGECTSDLAPYTVSAPNGWQLGAVTVSGDQAIVTITADNLCEDYATNDNCWSNSDPNDGQPSGTGNDFSTAYGNADMGGDTLQVVYLQPGSALCSSSYGGGCPSNSGWYVVQGVGLDL